MNLPGEAMTMYPAPMTMNSMPSISEKFIPGRGPSTV